MSHTQPNGDGLPTGTLLLEASAGTGKTHAIAELARRYASEQTATHPDGVPISRLLLITFSNQAALELRHRVFRELTKALGRSSGDQERRLARALREFDQAPISTIHSFCEHTLRGLGVLGDWDDADVITSAVDEVVDQCISDVYISRYLDRAALRPAFKLASRIGRAAALSTLPLKPDKGEPREFAAAARQAFRERRQRESWTTFDDLQTRLRELLESEVGPLVRQQLQQRYDVLLIDEFQDTDPDQWAIIEKAFIAPNRPTIMIGDPKQSIYGFRNADLVSYGRAAALSEVRTLTTNFRSDPAVVHAVTELFDDVTLGAPDIRVRPVDVHHQSRFSIDGAEPAGLWLRTGSFETTEPTTAIDADVRAHILHLLRHGRITDDDRAGRPVQPSDIVILTRSRNRGLALERKLTGWGIPAVWSASESVLKTEAARQWAAVINAMVKLDRTSVVLAAVTPLMGFELHQLMDAEAGAFAEASRVIHTAARQLRGRSSRSWTRTVLGDRRAAARLGGTAQGERTAIALEQVADVLMSVGGSDAVALQEDFERLCQHPVELEHLQRVPTGPEAVRIQTLHSAKGLQFPIVLLPEVSGNPAQAWRPFPFIDQDQERHLWVGTKPGKHSDELRRFDEQSREEELRLLYVGITRSRHLCVAWHAMDDKAAKGALTALLARRKGSGQLEREYQTMPPLEGRFDPRLVDVAPIGQLPVEPLPPAPGAPAPVTASTFTRKIDQIWRRTSYSGLTADLHEVASGMDETDALDLEPAPGPGQATLLSPMAALPGGAGFGTAVHQMMEELDWGHQALTAHARELAALHGPAVGLDPAQLDALGAALVAISTTPLGPLTGGLSLRDIPIASRLSELDFDLPMADRGPARTVAHLASAMSEHLAADDPLRDYPDRLAHSPSGDAVLAGVLTGSIDAVLQLPSGGFIIVDYKTNRFPTTQDEPLRVAHYHAAAMAEAMMQSHYPLQALLYGAALHRYLSWRLPGYQPERDLAGVGYLFVRGMGGPTTPTAGSMPAGVFTWRPPAALFVAASEILGGGS